MQILDFVIMMTAAHLNLSDQHVAESMNNLNHTIIVIDVMLMEEIDSSYVLQVATWKK